MKIGVQLDWTGREFNISLFEIPFQSEQAVRNCLVSSIASGEIQVDACQIRFLRDPVLTVSSQDDISGVIESVKRALQADPETSEITLEVIYQSIGTLDLPIPIS